MDIITSSITCDGIKELRVIYHSQPSEHYAGMAIITTVDGASVYFHFRSAAALEKFERDYLDVIPEDRREEPICPQCRAPCRVRRVDDSFSHHFGTEVIPVYCVSDCCDAEMDCPAE